MVLYRWGVRRRRKTVKHGEVGVKRKCWVLAHPPNSPQGNRRQSLRVETWSLWDRPADAEENQGAGIVKGWEDKQDRGRILIHSRKTRIRRARAP